MTLLVRKINRHYWPAAGKTPLIDVFDQNADGITNCLRTTKKQLSVWEISTLADLPKAILAISTGFKKLETFDVVLIDRTYLTTVKIPTKNTPGRTPVKSLASMHVDIEDLNYFRIGLIAEHIIHQISKSSISRFDIAAIQNIVNNAINAGLLDKGDLEPEFADKL